MNNTSNMPTNNPQNINNDEDNSNRVEKILDKIKNLPIANDEKALLMKQLKTNMMTPSKNEDTNLEHIKNKYLQTIPQQMLDPNYSNEQSTINLQTPFYNDNHQKQYNPQQLQPSNLMTTVHFEILKNKIDSLQYELIDLLRHVKDYTQRYMNSVRQQDLDKIDDYINGLFEVDKVLKETKEKAKQEQEEAVMTSDNVKEDTEQSMIAKTTNGISSFIGNIGNSVSGITGLVSSTANLANNYLSKKIIGSPEDTTTKSLESPTTTTTTTTTKPIETSSNKNILSINDYINERNENKLKETNSNGLNNNNSNSISLNSSNINKLELNNNSKKSTLEPSIPEPSIPEPSIPEASTPEASTPEESTTEASTPEESTPENLGTALEELNNEIEKDINSTLLNQNTIQSGGNKKTYLKLKNNIEILNLKLTKKKLQKKLNITNKKNKDKKRTKHKINKNRKNTKRKN